MPYPVEPHRRSGSYPFAQFLKQAGIQTPKPSLRCRGLRLHAQYLMAVRSRQLAKSLVGCLGFQDSPSHGARTVIGENSLFHSLTLASSGSEAKWPISPHDRSLTSVAQKPRLVIEQATSSYSFRSSELSQPI